MLQPIEVIYTILLHKIRRYFKRKRDKHKIKSLKKNKNTTSLKKFNNESDVHFYFYITHIIVTNKK